MGLSTLINAIEYLEYMEQLERGRQSTGSSEESVTFNVPSNQLHFRRLDSTASGSVVVKQGEEQQHPHVKEEREEKRTSFLTSSKSKSIPAGMLARRRRMHNILEKSRRAQMRGCLNVLKEILPPPTSHEGTPYGRILTTSTTLANSVKYIKQLEGEGAKLEGEVKRLKEIKKELEENLAELNGEVGGRGGVDLEVTVPPEIKEEGNAMEITSASTSSAAATPAPMGLQSQRSSLDVSPVPGVTVEEVPVIIAQGN